MLQNYSVCSILSSVNTIEVHYDMSIFIRYYTKYTNINAHGDSDIQLTKDRQALDYRLW